MSRPQHKTLGKCRRCSRNVIDGEGHMKRGRYEHHDCAAAIERMDTRRNRKGKAPVQRHTPAPTTRSDPRSVKIIDMTTGAITYQMAYSEHQLERINHNADRRPRTWNQASPQGRPAGGTRA